MKFENIRVYNFENALRGMRNPLASWKKIDSEFGVRPRVEVPEGAVITHEYENGLCEYAKIGPNDMGLAKRLIAGGSEHRKFLRQIFVTVDITAPLLWWKEADTYKVGTVANSTSTMHCGLKQPFSLDQFELSPIEEYSNNFFDVDSDIAPEDIITKDIAGFENYTITNTGEIYLKPYELIDSKGIKRHYNGHIVKQAVNSSNYKKVTLRKDGVSYNKYVHRLLAENFIPNPNNLPDVNHKDGNKWNNNLSNLEWVTEQENTKHAHANGLAHISHYNRFRVGQTARRFDYIEVQEILQKVAEGYTQKEVADMFHCYDSTINNIVNGKLYNAVEPTTADLLQLIIDDLNDLRDQWLIETDPTKKQLIWKAIISLLPESWLQTRTVTMNYENLLSMYHQRRNHKLTEWSIDFINFIKSLPYASDFLIPDEAE